MSERFICCNCHEGIKAGNYLQLGEKFYHPHHFYCHTCKKSLDNEEFSEHEDQVYCEAHYLEVSGAPKCSKCDEFISGKYNVIQGKNFHSECLKCDKCKKPFPRNEYYKDGRSLLCALCFKSTKAKICFNCEKPIISNEILAMNNFYHEKCFLCLKCGKSFDEGGFLTIDGNPFHEECVAVYCDYCGEEIEQEYYEIEDQCIHERCLENYKKRLEKSKSNKSKNVRIEIEKKISSFEKDFQDLENEQNRLTNEFEQKIKSKKEEENITTRPRPPSFSLFMKDFKKQKEEENKNIDVLEKPILIGITERSSNSKANTNVKDANEIKNNEECFEKPTLSAKFESGENVKKWNKEVITEKEEKVETKVSSEGEKVEKVSVEKKFIKMHNKFKKI